MRSLSKVYKDGNVQLYYSSPYVLEDIMISVHKEQVGQEEHAPDNDVPVDTILEEAGRRAESIIKEAESEAKALQQQIFESARKDGYDRGYNDGYKDGLQAGRSQYDDMIAEARHMVDDARKEKDKAMRDAERELVELAISIAKEVLEHEISVDRDTIVYLAKKALKRCYYSDGITIRVRDEDYGTLIEHLTDFTSAKGENVNITILKDAAIDEGTCLIDTPTGTIDASIDTQMDIIAAKLRSLSKAVNG
ncbi:MAG: Flagellar assembly protein FliH/Type secretion system HrpE [Mahella sp.]|nr:Flagellar assembly protein FliH/Type secretion system HrpE [Mahella sp.]MDK2903152.1 flagellar assembly protein FliH [Clostridiales bacterium]